MAVNDPQIPHKDAVVDSRRLSHYSHQQKRIVRPIRPFKASWPWLDEAETQVDTGCPTNRLTRSAFDYW